jgi:serine/threonine-protein kinase
MSPKPAPIPGGEAAPARRNLRRIWWIAVPVLLATVAGAVFWSRRMPEIRTVVVRPFTSESGEEWLAGAITREIGEALQPVNRPEDDPQFTGVLEGTVARSGDRLRITAQLTRPDGRLLWTRAFERSAADAATSVASAVVSRARKKNVRRKPPGPAYEKYLEARQLFLAGEVAKAAAGFERSVQEFPDFGLAWAWLSISREYLADRGEGRPNDLMPAARDAAERAATLEPGLADPHLALGIVKLQYDWDWNGARQEIDRAIELDPAEPFALHWRERWLEAVNGAPAPKVEIPAAPSDPEGARKLLAEAENLREQRYIPAAALVMAATLAKDNNSLFRWLDAAYEERSVQLPYLLRSPALPLSDPRIVDLVRRLKLPTNP